MARGLTRLTAELAGTATGNRPSCWVEPGTVKATVAGYGADATITVTWRGVDVPCSYVSTYSPADGDVVLLLIQPPSVICLGRLIGPDDPTADDN